MLALVTGATGHLGAALVRALLARGHTVRGLAHAPSPALEGLPVEFYSGDVTDRACLDGPMRGVQRVFHLAALVTIQEKDDARALHVNAVGPRNVADAALAAGVRRMVHFSSVHALTPPEGDGVTDESAPPNTGPKARGYDRSKAMGELEIQAAIQRGLDAVIVNPTGVIGPYDFRPRLSNRLILDVARRALPALTSGGFNWVDARDVAEGAIAAAERGRTGERYLLSGHWVSIAEMGQLAARIAQVAPPSLVVPLWVAYLGIPFTTIQAWVTGRDPVYTRASIATVTEHKRCDSQKAREELGYHARPIEESVRDTIRFFRMVGLIDPKISQGRPLPLPSDLDAEGA